MPSTELVRRDAPHALPAPIGLDLVGAIFAELTARTARTYSSDYRDFARFLGASGPGPALDALVAMSPGQANAMALAYRVHLSDRQLAPGTIARRLVALRSAVKAARRIGLITWGLDVGGPKAETLRDTRGPGLDGWRKMLATAKAEASTPKGLRDLALVRLLHDLGLRRGEAVSLDLANVDLEARTVAVVGKGKRQATRLTLPRPTADSLAAWIASRGNSPGPLFRPLDPGASPDERLTGEAVRRIVAALGKRSGLARVPRPHGLRHSAVTEALDAGRDIRDVRRFARHADINTTIRYDDNRRDVAGEIADLIAGE